MRIRGHNYLFQWDTKRELEIKEPDAVCVDFARLGETPIRVKIEDGVVKIPDIWLQTSGNQHIYVCYRDGTISDHILQIQRRDQPPEYEANPDDAWSYDDLQADLENKIQTVQDDLNAAKEKSAADIAKLSGELTEQDQAHETAYASLTASLSTQTDRVDPLKEAVEEELAKKPDTTLSIAGEAADAKAAGDAMNQLADTCKLIADRLDYSDLRALEDLTDCGVITPATDGENAYTDAAGNVFVL
nr:MAG TPA: hypothetical protein [Caudoviricetes sp.]